MLGMCDPVDGNHLHCKMRSDNVYRGPVDVPDDYARDLNSKLKEVVSRFMNDEAAKVVRG